MKCICKMASFEREDPVFVMVRVLVIVPAITVADVLGVVTRELLLSEYGLLVADRGSIVDVVEDKLVEDELAETTSLNDVRLVTSPSKRISTAPLE